MLYKSTPYNLILVSKKNMLYLCTMNKEILLESRIKAFKDILEEALYKIHWGKEDVPIMTLYLKHFKLTPYDK